MKNSREYLPALDGIRGIAIILVMLYHFTIPFQLSEHLNIIDGLLAAFLQIGWVGVDLFFVLSGFLITGILYDTAGKDNYLKNFFVRRFLRIFPLYYLMLFVLIVFIPNYIPSLASKTDQMVENQFWFWSYLINWRISYLGTFEDIQGGYMWSLALEEQFYLIWPFFILFFKKKVVSSCFILLIVFAFLRLVMLLNGVSATSIYTMTFTHLDALLAGSIIAVARKEEILKQRHFKALSILCFVSVFVVLAVLVFTGKFIFYQKAVAHVGLLSIAIISSYVLIKAVYSEGNKGYLARFFSFGFIQEFGKLCYGLYLFHHPIGLLVTDKLIAYDAFILFNSYLPCLFVNILVSMFVSYIFAWLSFKFFESQFLKLKKYFV